MEGGGKNERKADRQKNKGGMHPVIQVAEAVRKKGVLGLRGKILVLGGAAAIALVRICHKLPPCPVEELGSVFFITALQVFIHVDKFPLSLLFSRLSDPSDLSFFSYNRHSNPLIIIVPFVGLTPACPWVSLVRSKREKIKSLIVAVSHLCFQSFCISGKTISILLYFTFFHCFFSGKHKEKKIDWIQAPMEGRALWEEKLCTGVRVKELLFL